MWNGKLFFLQNSTKDWLLFRPSLCFLEVRREKASILLIKIIKRIVRSVAQSGSASGLGPEGREFESLHSDHTYK